MRRQANSVKQKLQDGQPVLGVVSRLGSPIAVELIGLSGFDFVWIDMEHATTGLDTLEDLCRAAQAVDLPVLVRVPDRTPSNISRALDAGASIVNVPLVETVEQAAEIADAA